MNMYEQYLQLRKVQEDFEAIEERLFKMPRHEVIAGFFDYNDPVSIFNILRGLGITFRDNSEDLGEEFFENYTAAHISFSNGTPYINFMTVEQSDQAITLSMPARLPGFLPKEVMSVDVSEKSETMVWDIQFSLYLTIVEEILHILQLRKRTFLTQEMMFLRNTGLRNGYTMQIMREYDVLFHIFEMLGYKIRTPMELLHVVSNSKIDQTKWFKDRFAVYGNCFEFFEKMMDEELVSGIQQRIEDATTLEEWKSINADYLYVIRDAWERPEIEKLILKKYVELSAGGKVGEANYY